MDRIIAAYCDEGARTQLGAAILLTADLADRVEAWCLAPMEELLERAERFVDAERGRGTVIWTEYPSDWRALPADLATDRCDRAARLWMVETLFGLTGDEDPEAVVADALADLWHWCHARSLRPPDSLLPLAELLNAKARGLH